VPQTRKCLTSSLAIPRQWKLTVNLRLDLHHIQLELRKVTVLTTKSGQLQESHSNAVTQNLNGHHLALRTRIDQHYQDLNGRIDLLEQLILQLGKEETTLPDADEIQTLDEKGMNKSPKLDALRVLVSQPIPCRNWCPCTCHTKRKPNAIEPGITEKLIGKMFVGYAGLPFLKKRCDFKGCTHQRAPNFVMEYWFPWWFVALNVKLDIKYLPNAGPQFQLTTSRRVPDTSQSIMFVMQRNIEGLKYLFSHGLASVRDVSDSRGFTLMRVSLLFDCVLHCRAETITSGRFTVNGVMMLSNS
jgi:hypothetical protein